MPDSSRAAATTLDAGFAFLCFLRSAVREHAPQGLTVPQFRILHILSKGSDQGLSDFADDLGISPAALSKAIDALVERGLVERAVATEDRRRVELALTASGKRLVATSRGVIEQALEARLAGLGKAELAGLDAGMRTLQAVLAKVEVMA